MEIVPLGLSEEDFLKKKAVNQSNEINKSLRWGQELVPWLGQYADHWCGFCFTEVLEKKTQLAQVRKKKTKVQSADSDYIQGEQRNTVHLGLPCSHTEKAGRWYVSWQCSDQVEDRIHWAQMHKTWEIWWWKAKKLYSLY